MTPNNSPTADFRGSKRARQRGSIAILGTVTLTALFGMLGLTFDAAYLYHLRRNAQMAADAGAKAGSIEMQSGSSNTTITTQVKAEVATNGFTDGTNGVTVTVNKPPVGGSWNGNANAVQVIVKQAVPTSFIAAALQRIFPRRAPVRWRECSFFRIEPSLVSITPTKKALPEGAI